MRIARIQEFSRTQGTPLSVDLMITNQFMCKWATLCRGGR